MPAVFAKSDCGFSPNVSKHTKARKQAGLRLHPCQAGLCLLSAPSRTAASRRVRQSIQKRENKSDCVYPHQAKPFLLSPLGRAAITSMRRSRRAAGVHRPCGWGGGRFWRACRRGFCTERRFSAGGSSWECFGLQDKQGAKQIELCLPFSPSRTSASHRMRQSIQKQENKRDCVCIPVKQGCACCPRQARPRLLAECVKAYKREKTSRVVPAPLSIRTVPAVLA